ncbi:MAG: Asp-tRNA(Asn)/Glu-tRNA(Gln) amidotransferase subunit GatC [Spirochaetes bacterium]|nr:Asp-tRNA(Asn)/Glu-tRNA(Gln) amidotransferase subunit GatC [Spirochaetota bacterium]
MSIDAQTVKKTAKLARLELTENEISQLTVQMEKIVKFVEKINQLDTEGIVPTAHVLDIKNVSREDAAVNSSIRDELLKLAPESKDGFILVPRVIE